MHTGVQSEMIPADAHRVLAGNGWLSTQPREIQDRLLAASEVRNLPAHSTVYGLDDPPGGIYGIVEGFVDVLAAPGPFRMRLVHVAGVGWWAGEAAAASLTTRRVELRTRTKVAAAYISKWKLDRVAEQHPAIWRNLAVLTASHLDMAMLYAVSFASDDLKLRLVMSLVRTIGPAMESGGWVTLPIGQAEFAELTGLSRNTISRLLAQLSVEGCVERHYGSITVNVDCVRSLVEAASRMPSA